MTMRYVAIVLEQKENGEITVTPLATSANKQKLEDRKKDFDRFKAGNQICDLFDVEEI